MKYRMIEKREVRHWVVSDTYKADTAYYVQRKFLFWWITLESYWDKPFAQSYLDALNECENE